mgnify:CR=1 FL=1
MKPSTGAPIVGKRYAWTHLERDKRELVMFDVDRVDMWHVYAAVPRQDEPLRMSIARWHVEAICGRIVEVPNHAPSPTSPPAQSLAA